MTPLCRWSAVLLSLLLSAGLLCTRPEAGAQEKKEEKKTQKKAEKKAEPKKDEKKTEAKKEEKKAEEKKVEPKEEKKEEFVPDRPLLELAPKLEPVKGSDTAPRPDWVNAIDYSDDGKTLAAAGRDRAVRIWDVMGKKELQILKAGPSNVKGMVYQQDKVYASTGKFNKEKKAYEGEIKVFDAKSGKELRTLVGHNEEIECLAISKDGKLLGSGSDDQTAKVWDLASGKDVQTLKGHTGAINSLAFTADGKKVATASADGTVKLWDAQSGKDLATFKVSETKIKKKDEKGKESEVIEKGRPFNVVAFSPDGKRLAAGTLDGLLKLYDVEGQKELREVKADEGIWALAFSPDGSKIATGGYARAIKVWDAASGKDVQTIKAHLSTVTAIAFSPAAPQLASGSIDGLIKIWALQPEKK